MVTQFDHVTIVVEDVEEATSFFATLGFQLDRSVVISGKEMAAYMGVDGIEAEHITLVLAHSAPRLEVQLLKYHHPYALADSDVAKLNRVGFNHICFAVDDLDAEVRTLLAHGATLRNSIMEFNDRRLVFINGPGGITVELAQWL